MSQKSKLSRRKVIMALTDMLERGESAKKVADSLAAFIVEQRQVRYAELYLKDLELELAKRFGMVTAYTVSAKQISAKTRTAIKDLIKDKTHAKEIELIEQIDPGLIGGVIIRTADAELDGSIKTKLRNLRSV